MTGHLRDTFLRALYGYGYDHAQPTVAAQMLADFPALRDETPYMACAVGDLERVREHTRLHPGWIKETDGPWDMPPLVALTFSSLVQLPQFEDDIRQTSRFLLDSGASPNQSWTDPAFPGNPLSALYGAAGRNHDLTLTEMLLQAGANANDNESLYHSLESRDPACTRALLVHGARVSGTNSLFHVLDFDDIDRLRLLLANGGDPNERSGHLGTPLHFGVRRGRSAEHATVLLEAGAHARTLDRSGLTPYRMAVRWGADDIASVLEKAGAAEGIPVEEQFLHACARADRAEAARILQEHPALISALTREQLQMLPNLAALGKRDAVITMVELGWPISLTGGDWNASALNLAVSRGDAELTEFLLQHGASWTERHGYNDNVVGTLSFSCRNDRGSEADWLGCARALVAHGMPRPESRYHFTPPVQAYFESLHQTS